MNNLLKLFFALAVLFFVLFTVQSCSKDNSKLKSVNLKVRFTASKTVLALGDTISFTDSTEGFPLKWQWYFEGGKPSSSKEQHPTNIMYDNLGEYSVRLIVSNAHMTDSLVIKKYIKVVGLLPVVSTATPYNFTINSAIGGGEVEDQGTAPLEEVGIVWSENTQPTVNDFRKYKPMTEPGEFSFVMDDLKDNSVYYYRAYGKSSLGTTYGEEHEFKTLEIDTCDYIDDWFVDSRDGNRYRFFEVGGKVWMGDNLNYNSSDSWCYNDDETNCTLLGRLYTFEAAENVCPAGWKLPSVQEWNELLHLLGTDAGTKMKNKNAWGDVSPATNNYCFSAKPAGYKNLPTGRYSTKDYFGFWWTSSSNSDGNIAKSISYDNSTVIEDTFEGDKAVSVRCLKK